MVSYVLWFLFLVLMMFLKFLPISPILMCCAFVLFLIFPGFLLSRILKQRYEDLLDNIVMYLVLGLSLNLIINLLAIFLGATLAGLNSFMIILLFVLFFASFLLDTFVYKKLPKFNLNIKKYLRWENLPVFLLILIAFWEVVLINLGGAIIEGGDFLYHLSIIRKITENQPLTISNLNYVKDIPHIAYIFPIWHIFLAQIGKFFPETDIFNLWQMSVAPILILVFFSWYWLGKKILPNIAAIVLGIIFLIIYQFNILNTLPIPHSLTQFLLLPLSIGLALRYIYNDKAEILDLIILSVFAVLMAAVHLTAFFYYFLIIFIYGIVYAIFNFKTIKSSKTIKKIALAAFSGFAILLPLFLIVQSRSGTVTNFLQSFQSLDYPQRPTYDSFRSFTIYGKLGYLLLPFTFLFLKKHQKLYFLIALFLVLPLAYIPPVKMALIKLLGFIFVDRLFATTIWANFSIAIFFLLVLLAIDLAISKIEQKNFLKWFVNIILSGFIVLMFVLSDNGKFLTIKNWILSQNFNDWLNKYSILLAIVILGICIYLYLRQRNSEHTGFYLANLKSPYLGFIFISLVVILFLPFSDIKGKTSSSVKNLAENPSSLEIESWAYQYVGGYGAVNFINSELPPRSVFYTYKGDVYFFLPTVTNVQMPSYDSAAPYRYDDIYDQTLSTEERNAILKESKIEYILVATKDPEILSSLNEAPDLFTEIYQDAGSSIYKVNQ